MQVPLELSIRDVQGVSNDRIRALVEAQARKLEELAPELIACRVAVEEPQRHQRSGCRYRVRVRATVPPNKVLVASIDPGQSDMGTPLDRVIRDAFQAVARQLRDERARRRGDVKAHPTTPLALVVRMFPDADYGFLRDARDGHEIYFHRNSVSHDEFDRLTVGTQVRYMESLGDEGPQASSVVIVDKLGERAGDRDEHEVETALGWAEQRGDA